MPHRWREHCHGRLRFGRLAPLPRKARWSVRALGVLPFMEAVSRLAAHLDISMLLAKGLQIASEGVPDDQVPYAKNLTAELCSRHLIKYVRQADLSHYSALSGITFFPGRHFVTPMAVAAADLQSALALPPLPTPSGALLLNPAKLTLVRGPRRIAAGIGVEYIIDEGFTLDAIVIPQWAMAYD